MFMKMVCLDSSVTKSSVRLHAQTFGYKIWSAVTAPWTLSQIVSISTTFSKSPESAYAESGLFCLYGARLERSNAAVRWTAACRRLDGGNTSSFFPEGRNCKRVSPRSPHRPVLLPFPIPEEKSTHRRKLAHAVQRSSLQRFGGMCYNDVILKWGVAYDIVRNQAAALSWTTFACPKRYSDSRKRPLRCAGAVPQSCAPRSVHPLHRSQHQRHGQKLDEPGHHAPVLCG